MIRYDAAAGGFPSTVYHPVLGARTLTDANEATTLNSDWFNTAEEADMHRTETEAQMAVHKNQTVKAAEMAADAEVVRNSVAADASLKAGFPEPL